MAKLAGILSDAHSANNSGILTDATMAKLKRFIFECVATGNGRFAVIKFRGTCFADAIFATVYSCISPDACFAKFLQPRRGKLQRS